MSDAPDRCPRCHGPWPGPNHVCVTEARGDWTLPDGFEWHKRSYDCPIDGPRWCWDWRLTDPLNKPGTSEQIAVADRLANARNEAEFSKHRRGPATTTQKPPEANNHPAAWDLVLADLAPYPRSPDEYKEIIGIIETDIRARDAKGRRKYGVPLQPHNGRDMLVDAYQESLDLVVYLRAAKEEGLDVYTHYQAAVDMMIELRALLFERDGK